MLHYYYYYYYYYYLVEFTHHSVRRHQNWLSLAVPGKRAATLEEGVGVSFVLYVLFLLRKTTAFINTIN